MNREEFIDKVSENIKKYKGKNLENLFGNTAALWSFYLGDIAICNNTVPILLALHKLALTESYLRKEDQEDLYVEAMTYIALSGEMFTDDKEAKELTKKKAKKQVENLVQHIKDINPAIYKDNNLE